MSEKLCLQWNDFKENAIGTFARLKDDTDFADVTLACEDGTQLEAHKAILASSSPFFQNILKRNHHPHPLIYMRGVKLEDLLAIIEFLYCGEANVCQEDLELFLGIAEELQLPGLKRTSHNGDVIEAKKEVVSPKKEKKVKKKEKRATITSPGSDPLNASEEYQIEESGKDMVAEGNLSLSNNFSGDVKDLDEKCKTLMEKTSDKRENGNAIFMCKVCGKEEISSAIKNHIEAKHLEGVSLPCNFCDKTFRFI